MWSEELRAMMAAATDGALPSPLALVTAYVRHVANRPRLYAEWSAHLVHLATEQAREWDDAAIALACASFDCEYVDHVRKREVCETLYLTVIHVARCAAVRNPARLADGTVERELIALVEGYLAPVERKE
jgi:hypothetical protein